MLTTQYLSNLADVREGVSPGSISHYTVQRVIDVLVNTQGRDLGSLTIAIKQQIKKTCPSTRHNDPIPGAK
ncbi:hypothetical protein B1A_10749 [mine drainage metagenome]|uniref:Uncharacterized protein n=1 Tax=mine drainage metagenome TaxID=410659 RepID=T1APW7_9ZZZZ